MSNYHNWIRANKTTPCLVCGATDWCQNSLDELAANCHRSDIAPPGWNRGKQLKDGGYNYQKDCSGQGFDRESWLKEKAAERKLRQEAEQKNKPTPLSLQQLHKQFKELLIQLPLAPQDKADLERRGLSEDEIALGLFKSVEKYQKLNGYIDPKLPGVQEDGRSLNIWGGYQGYLCPIRNVDGLIIGSQVRRRVVDERGRYFWLTSRTKNRPTGMSSHLPNGELPMAVCDHGVSSRIVGLCEGTGVKPFVTSLRLGLIILGAASGNFTSVKQQFKETLEKLNPELLVLFPDGGCKLNKSVMWKYRDTVKLARDLGYKISVAWWGQETKESPDIDELTDLNYELLSWEDFAKDFISQQEPAADQPRDNNEPPLSEPDAREYARHKEWVEECAKNAEYDNERRKEEWKKNRDEVIKEVYRRHKTFTEDIKINQQYLDLPLPEENTINFYKSPLASGKTQHLISIINQLDDEGWLALGSRNSLLINSVERWKCGFSHLRSEHHKLAFSLLLRDPQSKVALCLDSLKSFKPQQLEDRNIILDETMSVVLHGLLSSTLKTHRDKTLELFSYALFHAKRIFCLDGMMADFVAEYIIKLGGDGKKVSKIFNERPPEKLTFNLITATDGGKLKKNDRSPLISQIKMALELGENIAICSDSQLECQTLDEMIVGMKLEDEDGKAINPLRVDSVTIEDNDMVKVFLTNPDKFISEEKVRVLIYSPTAESGLDISIRNWFSFQYAMFFGVLTTDQQIQMMLRLRDPNVDRYIWCKEKVDAGEEGYKSPLPREIEKLLFHQNIMLVDALANDCDEDAAAAFDYMKQIILKSKDDVHFKTCCKFQSRDNYERANLQQCLIDALKQAGHEVIDIEEESDTACKEEEKAGKEAVKLDWSTKYFNAPDITKAEADSLRGRSLKTADRCKLEKFIIMEQLPGIDQTPIWNPEFVKLVRYDKRSLIRQTELFWMLHHPEVSKMRTTERWYYHFCHLIMANQDTTHIPDLKSDLIKVQALLKVGIMQFLDPDKSWCKDSREVVRLVERCKDSKIKTALGFTSSYKDGIVLLKRLLGMVGLGLGKGEKSGAADSRGKRFYSLDLDIWNSPRRKIMLDCMDNRFQKYVIGERQIPKWTDLVDLLKTRSESDSQPSENVASLPTIYTTRGKDATSESGISPDVENCLGYLKVAFEYNDPQTIRQVWDIVWQCGEVVAQEVWRRLADWQKLAIQSAINAA